MTSLDTLRPRFRAVGAALAVVSALLTGAFGVTLATSWPMAALLAGGLMCATIASAYAWPFVVELWRNRQYGSALAITLFAALCTVTDLTTNFGSVAWQRAANVDTATVQNVVYDDRRAQVADHTAAIERWTAHLGKLEAEHAWLPTVTAEAMRAQLASAEKAIELEAARGGCKARCLALMQERDQTKARIAIAEERADIAKQLTATRKLIADAREKAAGTEKQQSAVVMQTASLASVATLSLNPTAEARHWTDTGVSWLVAAFLALGAIGCNLIGYGQTRQSNPSVGNVARALQGEPRRKSFREYYAHA